MKTELWHFDATDQAQMIRTGRASAREAVQSILGRLDAVNPYLNAVVCGATISVRTHDNQGEKVF